MLVLATPVAAIIKMLPKRRQYETTDDAKTNEENEADGESDTNGWENKRPIYAEFCAPPGTLPSVAQRRRRKAQRACFLSFLSPSCGSWCLLCMHRLWIAPPCKCHGHVRP